MKRGKTNYRRRLTQMDGAVPLKIAPPSPLKERKKVLVSD